MVLGIPHFKKPPFVISLGCSKCGIPTSTNRPKRSSKGREKRSKNIYAGQMAFDVPKLKHIESVVQLDWLVDLI